MYEIKLKKKFLVEVKDDENISMVSVYILCIYLCI